MDPLMWPCPIEKHNVGTQDTMQLLLMKDQHVVQALSPDTAQKAFTDRISSWRMIRRFQYLDTAGCCHMCETGSKLAIVITDEMLGHVSIRSCLPQLLCGPHIGGRSRHADMDDLPRSQFNDEKREERPKEEIGDLEKIAGPHISSVMMEESRPLLPTWTRQTNLPHVFLDRAFAHANIEFQ
jgi:hypothetical protein